MLNYILIFIYKIVSTLISWIPQGSGFGTDFHTAMSTLGSYVMLLDPIIPIQTLLNCLLVLLAVELGIFGIKTFQAIFGMTRGVKA